MRLAAVSKRHLLAVLLLCSLAMSFAGSRVASLRHAAQFALAPLGDAPMYAATRIEARLNRKAEPRLSDEQVEQLEAENRYLRRLSDYWQAQSEVFERQAQRLANFRRMYGPTSDIGCELIPARVVGAGSLPYDRTRVLSGGGRQGIVPGAAVTTREVVTNRSKALPPLLAVVNESSLVGRIVDSGAFTARLQLVTDRGFQISGRIRRVIVPGQVRTVTVTEGSLPRTTQLTPENNTPIDDVLAVGDGGSMVVVPDVKAYYNVQPGDQLWASAEKEYLPVDIYIGRVEKVERDAKDAHRVKVFVRPHDDVANVRDVFIISPLTTQAPRP
jgi:cell shape-determining protein MreC